MPNSLSQKDGARRSWRISSWKTEERKKGRSYERFFGLEGLMGLYLPLPTKPMTHPSEQSQNLGERKASSARGFEAM